MPEPAQPLKPYRFRRSQSLLALACWIPAFALAFIDFLSGNGLFWRLVQIVLIGAGVIIFWRENKRARIAMISTTHPTQGEGEPPSN